MDRYSVEGSTLTGIADAIREKTGGSEDIKVEDMAGKIGDNELVEVEITNTDVNNIHYYNPETESVSSLLHISQPTMTIITLKNSIIIISDTYGTNSSNFNSFTSTAGEIIHIDKSGENYAPKNKAVLVKQNGIISPYGY